MTRGGRSAAAGRWRERAEVSREGILEAAWNPEVGAFAATFGGDTLDASALLLAEFGLVAWTDPRLVSTLAALERALRRGDTLMRYAVEDDFGAPENAFNLCTFWLIEALARTGRGEEAARIFEGMLAARTAGGLLAEDLDPRTGLLWGNLPQTYSHVGALACAFALASVDG